MCGEQFSEDRLPGDPLGRGLILFEALEDLDSYDLNWRCLTESDRAVYAKAAEKLLASQTP